MNSISRNHVEHENIGKYKQTEVGLIPDDWKVNSIGDLFKFKQGIQVPVEKQFPTDANNRVRFIRIVDVTQKDEPPRFIDNPGQGHLIQKGNLFMVRYGAAGVVSNSFEGVIANNLFRLMSVENIDSNYYLYLLRYKYLDIVALSSSTTMAALNFGSLRELKLQTPSSLSEQTAIAEALSDADAMIASLEKLIEKKKKIKQGAMQELLRPKEGWVKKKIRDIASVGRGRVISHKEINAANSGLYPVYSSQTSNNGIMGYIDSFDFDGEFVTWTTDGEKAGTVFYRNGRFNCTNVCGTIKLKGDNARFVAYVLGEVTPMHVSRNLANPKLMNEPMKNIEICLPSIVIQNAISSTIKIMEEEIETLQRRLSKAVLIKQGMMQNLLTGKIRLV